MIEETKSLVIDDEFEGLDKISLFFWFLDYQDSIATNKSNGFSPQYSNSGVSVQIEFLMENFQLVGAEKKTSLIEGRDKKSNTFWKQPAVKTQNQGPQSDNSTNNEVSTIKKFSWPTLLKEIKPAVLLKYEFE